MQISIFDAINRIKEQKTYLERLERILQKEITKLPEGYLISEEIRGKSRYYWREDKKSPRKYLPMGKAKLIQGLGQRGYDEKLLKKVQKQIRVLEMMVNRYHPEELEDCYFTLKNGRKKLVHNHVLSETELIEQWKNEEYEGMRNDSEKHLVTERGENVRSKSEMLIATKLDKLKIPYKYEKALYLEGYGTVYPDFTIFIPKINEEVYLEHLGMMDDVMYVMRNIQKIQAYEKNGYYLGEKLFLTYETGEHPLDVRHVEKLLRHYFI